MALGQVKDGKPLRQIFFRPGSQLRVADLPVLECGVEQALRLYGIAGVEDGAYLSGHRCALLQSADIALRVVLQVELAALPGHAGQQRFACGLQTGMVVTGDELDPTQAALNQAVEKGPPVHLSLRQRHRDPQHPAVSGCAHADGDQHRAVHHPARFAHTLITRIHNHVRRLIQGASTPGLQARVELRRAAADLRAGDAELGPHQLLQDLDHFAGRDTLHVHLGHGQIHGLLRATAALQGAGVEAARAHLRHLKSDFAQAAQDGLVLVAVGVVHALGAALAGRCL